MTPEPATVVRTRTSLRVRALARLAGRSALACLVAALVLGILGMHALASHGTPAAGSSIATTTAMIAMSATSDTGPSSAAHRTAMATGDSHADHDHATTARHSALDADTGAGSSGHDMSEMAHLVMLCVVMLAAAALTLLAALVTGFLRPLRPAAFQPAAVREHALAWVRGTGPPHEWQFSVIRC